MTAPFDEPSYSRCAAASVRGGGHAEAAVGLALQAGQVVEQRRTRCLRSVRLTESTLRRRRRRPRRPPRPARARPCGRPCPRTSGRCRRAPGRARSGRRPGSRSRGRTRRSRGRGARSAPASASARGPARRRPPAGRPWWRRGCRSCRPASRPRCATGRLAQRRHLRAVAELLEPLADRVAGHRRHPQPLDRLGTPTRLIDVVEDQLALAAGVTAVDDLRRRPCA